ncbi:hypothetical protein H6A07_09765, partial [Olsenella uli]|uniref:hypothetical protein n=1 Tax=Olsenella uli TaxID=133926 RepID=UPI00195A4901
AEGRRLLERASATDGTRLSEKDLPAVEKLLDAADKRGVNTKYVRESIANAKRLYKLGINEQNYQQALDAVEELGTTKREPTKEEKIAKA